MFAIGKPISSLHIVSKEAVGYSTNPLDKQRKDIQIFSIRIL